MWSLAHWPREPDRKTVREQRAVRATVGHWQGYRGESTSVHPSVPLFPTPSQCPDQLMATEAHSIHHSSGCGQGNTSVHHKGERFSYTQRHIVHQSKKPSVRGSKSNVETSLTQCPRNLRRPHTKCDRLDMVVQGSVVGAGKELATTSMSFKRRLVK